MVPKRDKFGTFVENARAARNIGSIPAVPAFRRPPPGLTRQDIGNFESFNLSGSTIEMTPLKSVLLTVFMISGIAIWAVGIYSADAAADHVAVDGYGVTGSIR